jgi:periplasmic copper chaperone A
MKSLLTAAALVIAGTGLSHAHATFESAEVATNTGAKFVLRVPHGCGDEATNTVRIQIPEGVIGVRPMPKAGWDLSTVTRPYQNSYDLFGTEVTEGVTEIVWTNGNLPSEFYDEFVFQARIAPAIAVGTTVYFPAIQECATGTEAWIEIPAEGQDAHDLEGPAPGVTVVEAHGHSH